MTNVPRALRAATRAAAAALLLLAGCGGGGLSVDLAIVNANVVPMDRERVLENQTLLVDGGRIVEMGPAASIRTRGAARVVDAGGGYVLPGLADMHVHVWSERDLVPYVANGITLVRNMWGSPAILEDRARVEAGELLGPTIVTAGPIVDGDPPTWDGSAVAATPEDGRRIVREHQAAGYDFIKVYGGLTPETLDAIVAEAKARGIPVAGHVPDSVSLDHALRLGMASIEHLTGFARAVRTPTMPSDLRGMVDMARGVAEGRVAWSRIIDPDRLAEVADLAAATGTWQVPTLIVNQRIRTSRRQARELMERPAVRFMSPIAVASWNPDTDFRLRGVSDDDLEAMQILFQGTMRMVTALHAAGAGILAGTDPPNPHVLHGFSLHEELALLHEAGLSRFETLVATTRGPAEFLDQTDEFGTVAVGRRADLVLVNGNPLDDLAVLKTPVGVVVRGIWHPREELDSALEAVAASYQTPADWFADVEVPTLPVAVDATAEHRITFNGTEIGAVRTWSGPREDGGRVYAAQTVQDSGERIRSDCTVEVDVLGDFARASCEQQDPRGEHRFVVRLDGGRVVLEGTRANGAEIADTVELEGPPFVVLATMVPGMTALADRFDGTGPGSSGGAAVAALNNEDGELGLVRESWTVEREPDRDGQAVVRASVTGPLGAYTVEMESVGAMLTRAVLTYQMGVLTLEPRGGGGISLQR